jgi:hypothetical protein
LQGLTPSASTDYSLWKATKRLKRVTTPSLPLRTPQGTWARSNLEKAQAFADHLASVFQPHPPGPDPAADEPLHQLLETPYQLDLPIPRLTRTEIQTAILSLHPKKSPGYDLITSQILQALPPIGIQYLTQLFNAVLLHTYSPAQWKVAQIILILKPGKPSNELPSYRPISLLPLISKVFEKLLHKRLLPLIETASLIPNHQFGFRSRHSTIQQTHRIVHRITQALENKH